MRIYIFNTHVSYRVLYIPLACTMYILVDISGYNLRFTLNKLRTSPVPHIGTGAYNMRTNSCILDATFRTHPN